MASVPFVDPETTELDLGQIYREAVSAAALILLFGALALIPFLLVVGVGGDGFFAILMTLVAQFVLAVGGAVVLMYVVARGIQLSGGDRAADRSGTFVERE